MFRVGLGYLAAPFAPALFQAAVVAIWPKEGMGVFENPPSMFVAICIYFYVFGLLIGGPTLLIMRKWHVARLKAHATAGAAAGLLPVGTALSWTTATESTSAYVVCYNLLFFGLGGIAAGMTYCFISRSRSFRASPQPATH